MKTEKINIEGMSCQHCVMAVKNELSKLDLNLKDVQIGSAEIEYDENKVSADEINNAIEEAGYKLV
ncbi:MAG TPA: cation transporter [Ignavibacteriaceae bacterium]|nr:cation transporter [Ignavibacteriaceae bacterium]